MLKKTISILFILALAGCAGGEGDASLYIAKIGINGENRYNAVRLTPQIYNVSNRGLSDVLIKDGAGENVPYFINSGVRSVAAATESYPMELINSYVKDDNFYFDYRLAAPGTGDTVATSIEFTTNSTNFAKTAAVFGSYDDIHWEYIQSDNLYAVGGVAKLKIEFQEPQKFTHYRLELDNNLERISFNTADIVYSIEMIEETYFIETFIPEFSVEYGDRITNIIIEGLKNLRLSDVTIETDSMFKRTAASSAGFYKEIYNLTLNDETYADTTIPLDWYISPDKAFTVTISDGDDKPINVNRIIVRYYADDVVFEGKSGEAYTLVFGRDSVLSAPVYDVERYKNEILSGEVDKASINEIIYAAGETRAPERDYRMAFNAMIIIVTLLLGTVIALKLRRSKAQG